jgi:Plasmid replication region DNA-binding N-term
MAITRESIWTAADQLDAEGDRPTLAAIRKKLGGGSYSTISEAMTEWHARRTQKAVQAEPVPEKLLRLPWWQIEQGSVISPGQCCIE